MRSRRQRKRKAVKENNGGGKENGPKNKRMERRTCTPKRVPQQERTDTKARTRLPIEKTGKVEEKADKEKRKRNYSDDQNNK